MKAQKKKKKLSTRRCIYLQIVFWVECLRVLRLADLGFVPMNLRPHPSNEAGDLPPVQVVTLLDPQFNLRSEDHGEQLPHPGLGAEPEGVPEPQRLSAAGHPDMGRHQPAVVGVPRVPVEEDGVHRVLVQASPLALP